MSSEKRQRRSLAALRHVLLLLPAVAALLLGILSGLVRLGWMWGPASLGVGHGPLMLVAFLGALISLERAAALGRAWGYFVPPLAALAGLLSLVPEARLVATVSAVLAGAGLLIMMVVFVRRHRAVHTRVVALGAVAWFVGNLLEGTRGVPVAVPWWAAFLVLTIVGERLELGRLVAPGRIPVQIFTMLVFGEVVALGVGLVEPLWGQRLLAAAHGGFALWLLRYDIARRTWRRSGLPRFLAVALLIGYGWLAAHALVAATTPHRIAGLHYDLLWHTLFVGFVFAMIFAHGPIVFPALTGRRFRFHQGLYLPLALLNVGLIVRLVGDLVYLDPWRRWGGLLNGVAILLYGAAMLRGLRRP